MPRLEEVRFYLRGLMLLAMHDPQGFRQLDLTDRGMVRSFWAIVWTFPAILVSWLWRRALFLDGMPEGFRPGSTFYLRLAMVEAAGWIFPIVVAGILLFALKAEKFFPAAVVVNNWLSVPFAYAYTVLVILLVLLPGAAPIISLLWLALVFALVTMLFRILYLVCEKQNLMAGTLTMLLLVPPLLLADWLQRFLGIFPV
ncbi:hypothetical protein NOF55_01635 [Rhizobiaceae bacterium BDR2-2]|uniref:Yip1 domain-containing protein n=1 Tax=Ectorhizobium quercum TaxID=2965071 RepID=A0AAE3MWV6_9HYPH|nr:hypothetical protein [Ectorhizobium quercum]MCX8995802.1 hypothetical protein [Ectorhizobium quercum]